MMAVLAPDEVIALSMVTDDHHQRTCADHRRFETYWAALAHYVAQVREGRGDPGQEVFRCRACRGWHHGGSQVYSLGRLLAESGWADE